MARVADHLRITRGAVAMWQRVPAERVRAVSECTGIAPHQLRPDLFDAPPPAQLRRPADAIERANDDAEQRGATMTRAPSRHRRDRRAA